MTYQAKRDRGAEGAPLVLTFHGTGATEAQLHGLARDLVPGAHVTSPRGDVSEMGALRFFRRKAEGVYDMEDLAARTAAMAEFIASEQGVAGADRVIGIGYSNGANILASVALHRPDLVDDLVLLHPLIPWTPAPQPGLAGRRVLITAGERDPICPAAQTSDFAHYLADQGALVRVVWHTGGHEVRPEELDAARDFLAAEPAATAAG